MVIITKHTNITFGDIDKDVAERVCRQYGRNKNKKSLLILENGEQIIYIRWRDITGILAGEGVH